MRKSVIYSKNAIIYHDDKSARCDQSSAASKDRIVSELLNEETMFI